MSIEQYFAAQQRNLANALRWGPFAALFPLVDDLYVRAIALTPGDQPAIFGQLLLVCHKSFLSAVALIGQAQPDDAGPITRRAIEAARLAAAIRTDPSTADRWSAYEQRMQRWIDRHAGSKPKVFRPKLGQLDPAIAPVIEELMKMDGTLSDLYVHLTPENLLQLAWESREGTAYLNYFVRDQQALRRDVILTSGTYLRILLVMDWCLGNAFSSNPDWRLLLATACERGEPFAQEFTP